MSLQSKLDLANLGRTTVTKPCFDCVICFFCSHKISHFSPSKQTLKLIFFDKIQLTNYSSGLTSQFIEHLVLAFVHLSSELCISVPSNLIGLKLSLLCIRITKTWKICRCKKAQKVICPLRRDFYFNMSLAIFDKFGYFVMN